MTKIPEHRRQAILEDLVTMTASDAAVANFVSVSTVYRIQRAGRGKIDRSMDRLNRINRGASPRNA